MKAMVFAAGLGTRLRPLTDSRPKALVEVAGQTLLDHTLARLREGGVTETIVNTHHFADAIARHLKKRADLDMRVEISHEDVLLDTGGGLKKAGWFFVENGNSEPFVVHNVDIISTIDLRRMADAHTRSGALVTLAVRRRKTSRYLIFDENLQLCGRGNQARSQIDMARPCAGAQPLAFSGIHIISPRLLTMMTAEGPFPIIDFYLELSASGEKICGYIDDQSYWRDLGRLEDLTKAGEEIALWSGR
ncbi:MAG TPA: nucleotidyltransferase family protein [Terriglobia bacterium]|nr:nucleotidyltransferase family protein [Terriglobia bacterium]